ncbi:MAG: hypothetical protein HQM09_06535 [Candidatus Riflebacteria bacterium]|nr:hypothetical protein [Candidatus Riflebacteria bacterium]
MKAISRNSYFSLLAKNSALDKSSVSEKSSGLFFLLDNKIPELVYIRHYCILVAIGIFFSWSEDTRIMGEMARIDILLGLTKLFHLILLLKVSLDCKKNWMKSSSEFEARIKSKIFTSGLIVFLCAQTLSGILMFVVPQFNDHFQWMRTPLWMTIIVKSSLYLNRWWWVILPAVFGIPLLLFQGFFHSGFRAGLVPWLLLFPGINGAYTLWTRMYFMEQWINRLKLNSSPDAAFMLVFRSMQCHADQDLIQTFLESEQLIHEEMKNYDPKMFVGILKVLKGGMESKILVRLEFLQLISVILSGLLIGGMVFSFAMPMVGLVNICQ